MMKRHLFVLALMMSAAVVPARADEVSNRVDMLQQQLQQLTGQVEELTFTVKQLKAQIANSQKQQMGAADQPPASAVQKKKLAMASEPLTPAQLPKIQGTASGVETIGDGSGQQAAQGEAAPGEASQAAAASPDIAQNDSLYGNNDTQGAPAPKILGTMDTKAAKVGDGGFQGKLIVPPDSNDGTMVADAALAQPVAPAVGDRASAVVESVSVQAETPDDLFLRSEKSLLQLQYGAAESGFKEFLSRFPTHNLAGSAQYKLGEAYYAQQQYQEAAKTYLVGYKQFPKSRRAPDSMLKLGLTMNKMGQNQQACAVLGSVGDEFPNAVEAKKRAQAEYKRAGC
ncbi:MAG: tol-pal system protein YbgF [Alphaproteobacteria bacterium]|nr:tol-pal system protein YbgF [Alphaproteobacteria bacterium]